MKNVMTYKGYTARIEFDERDNVFTGKIIGIADSITFHGETVEELRLIFRPRSSIIWPIARPRAASP